MLVVAALFYLDLQSGAGVPSRARPSCSWMSTPPGTASTVCASIYATLQSIARAEKSGDNLTIRRLVASRVASAKIIAHGSRLRQQHVRDLHVAPSYTIGLMPDGSYEAVISLVGLTSGGKITAPQQLVLRRERGALVITGDRPDEEW
jgi:hypothetical protein